MPLSIARFFLRHTTRLSVFCSIMKCRSQDIIFTWTNSKGSQLLQKAKYRME